MKMGMELEFFLMKGKTFVFPADYHGLSHDGYPLLGELRTGIHDNPYKLIGEMQGLILEVKNIVKADGLKLVFLPKVAVPNEIRREAIRRPELSKTPEKQLNMHGLSHQPAEGFIYAGLHVHFSGKETKVGQTCEKCHTHVSYGSTFAQLPMPEIIRYLDKEFSTETAKADRVAGSYEMKSYGFEYRSLPNNISLPKLAEALCHVQLISY